jgi:cytochrome c oxidase subunit I
MSAPAPDRGRPAPLFRTCPTTGLQVHRPAERLIRAHAVVATVMLLVGGIAALLVLLTRWQVIHLLDAVWFYRILTVHGMNMLIFFIIFFEMAVLLFAGPVLLNCRMPAVKTAWGLRPDGGGHAPGPVDHVDRAGRRPLHELRPAAGALRTSTWGDPLRGGDPRHGGDLLRHPRGGEAGRTYEGSVPLVTFGALTAAIIAVITLVHGAAIYIPTWLWSMGLMEVDPQVYRMVWWGLGHSSQQINVAAMVSIWYLLATLTVGGVVLNQKVSRIAFVLYILFISMASAHHLLVDPGFGAAWKVWNTSYFMYMAVLASMIHGFTVPAGVEMGMRLRGLHAGHLRVAQARPGATRASARWSSRSWSSGSWAGSPG